MWPHRTVAGHGCLTHKPPTDQILPRLELAADFNLQRLPAVPNFPIFPGLNYSGMLVHVTGGRGVGQTRRVVSWDIEGGGGRHFHAKPSAWTLDAPFDPRLDNTSYINIGAFSGHITFEGNKYGLV